MDLMTRRRAIMGIPSGKDYTVSGNVVSVSNALAKNAKSLIVSFAPKQNGSGDPSPNNVRPITGYNDIGAVRYGKNLCPVAEDSRTVHWGTNQNDIRDAINELSAGTYTVTVKYKVNELPTGGVGYGVYATKSSGILISYSIITDNNPTVGKVYTVTKTFTLAEADVGTCTHFYLYCDNATTHSGTTGRGSYSAYDFQIEYGNTATSYEPYISPVTANVHVGGAGKNKLNPTTTSLTNSTVFGLSATWSSDGVLHFSGTWTGATANSVRVLNVDPNVRSLSVKGFSTGHVSLRWQNGEDRIVADFTSMTNGSTYDIRVWPMVYEGTAPTTYEPYSLFGGTVDLVSGECVVTHQQVNIPSSSPSIIGTYTDYKDIGWNFSQKKVGWINVISQAFKTQVVNGVPPINCIAGRAGNTYVTFGIPNEYADTASNAGDYIRSISPTITYELANPITYQLTPSQLAMLKGNNTVYSNEGSISLTYVGK